MPYDDEGRFYCPGGFEPDWYPDEHGGKLPDEVEGDCKED